MTKVELGYDLKDVNSVVRCTRIFCSVIASMFIL